MVYSFRFESQTDTTFVLFKKWMLYTSPEEITNRSSAPQNPLSTRTRSGREREYLETKLDNDNTSPSGLVTLFCIPWSILWVDGLSLEGGLQVAVGLLGCGDVHPAGTFTLGLFGIGGAGTLGSADVVRLFDLCGSVERGGGAGGLSVLGLIGLLGSCFFNLGLGPGGGT